MGEESAAKGAGLSTSAMCLNGNTNIYVHPGNCPYTRDYGYPPSLILPYLAYIP